MRATRLNTATAAAAAILLFVASCQALIPFEEAMQLANVAFWKFYGPSLPDCKGDWITSLEYAQAVTTCTAKLVDAQLDPSIAQCGSLCTSMDCQDYSLCTAGAIPPRPRSCPVECRISDETLGIPCAYQLTFRAVQDYFAWALALGAGQQLPAAASDYLRDSNDAFLQVNYTDVSGSRRRLLALQTWDELPVGDKLKTILDNAMVNLYSLSSCTYLRPA